MRKRLAPQTQRVEQARDAFLNENGFALAAYDAPRTPASILGIAFSVPNPLKHRWAIMRHDLHHVATGCGTDLASEAEVGAWECRAGLRPLGLYTGSIVLSITLLGLLIAPRRTIRAWRASEGLSLFHMPEYSYAELLSLTVGELRALVGLPASGLALGQTP